MTPPPAPHTTGWAGDKSCGCGVWDGEVCDCAAVIAEYAARVRNQPTITVVHRGGVWEVTR